MENVVMVTKILVKLGISCYTDYHDNGMSRCTPPSEPLYHISTCRLTQLCMQRAVVLQLWVQ